MASLFSFCNVDFSTGGCSSDVVVVLENVIDEVLHIFHLYIAWLFYPCDPGLPSFEVAFESTTPSYPGAKALKDVVPKTRDMANYCQRAFSKTGEPQVDPSARNLLDKTKSGALLEF